MLVIFLYGSVYNTCLFEDNEEAHSPVLEEISILSNYTDEGLEMSQRITDSIFSGLQIGADGEEIVSGVFMESHYDLFSFSMCCV